MSENLSVYAQNGAARAARRFERARQRAYLADYAGSYVEECKRLAPYCTGKGRK